MRHKPIEPNFRTPDRDLSGVERAKLNSAGLRANLDKQFRDLSVDEIVEESTHVAKSHGIYLEYNRAKTGREKDWMYMVRVSIPGGGPLRPEDWRTFDDLSEKYTINAEGKPSLRITTRQNIQFHWVRKRNLIDLVSSIARTGFYTLNGCGDNTRNVMGCPVSIHSDVYNAHAMARKFGQYFRLPAEPHVEIFGIDPNYIRTPEERFAYGPRLLNRKFKIAFSAVYFDDKTGRFVPDNCVEVRTNDVGIVPLVEDGKVERFQVYIGGSQGEKNGTPTFAAMGQAFGIFTRENLLKGVDAVVRVHQEWGDRQNRHWARLKYVVYKLGIGWYQNQVREFIGNCFEAPLPDLDIGDRRLHHGWMRQPSNGLLSYGAYIENGRIIDGPNGQLKTMVRYLADHYPIQVMTTPNQDLLFIDIPVEARETFENDLQRFGYGQRNGEPYSRLRILSGACVGLDTCRLSFTDSEKFEPYLIDELERRGWGNLAESIGITGCEKQCFRPATKTIGWVGMGKDKYMLKLMGTEDARHQGHGVMDEEHLYLRSVPREEVANVTEELFKFYVENRAPNEEMGYFHRRVGMAAIIDYLKKNPKTAHLMEKTFPPLHLPPPEMGLEDQKRSSGIT